jgi:hypothetical protein
MFFGLRVYGGAGVESVSVIGLYVCASFRLDLNATTVSEIEKRILNVIDVACAYDSTCVSYAIDCLRCPCRFRCRICVDVLGRNGMLSVQIFGLALRYSPHASVYYAHHSYFYSYSCASCRENPAIVLCAYVRSHAYYCAPYRLDVAWMF